MAQKLTNFQKHKFFLFGPARANFEIFAVSLHRSRISENFDFKEYVIDAGSGSRIRPATARPILLLFGDKNSQRYVSILLY
jgi:hypothetical protein